MTYQDTTTAGTLAKTAALCGVALALLCGSARAQSPANSTVMVQIPELNCTFQAQGWSIGAAKAGQTPVTVWKQFDACSTALYQRLVSGTHLKEFSLSQTDAVGQLAIQGTTGVWVSSYQMSDSTAAPEEAVTFLVMNAAISGDDALNLPVAGKFNTTIQAPGLGCSFPALSWSIGANSPAGQVTAASSTSHLSLDDLSFLKTADSCSLALSQAAAQGQHLASVVLLTQPVGVAGPVTQITLQDVIISAGRPTSSKTVPGTEQISLTYTKIDIQNVSANTSASWNLKTNQPN